MPSREPAGLPVDPSTSALRPLGVHEVRLTEGFWKDLEALNAGTILAHCESWMERIGWIANFDRAAAGRPFEHAGIEFVDSEVYKLLEAMAWELGARPDAALAARYAALVDRVGAAQEADGYLHTAFGRPGQRARWSDLEQGHELYCAGHLIQAAVARLRTGVDDELPAIARRVAAHLFEVFGPEGRTAVCGHPEIEMALVELSRATGDRRHLELARLFVERRGAGLLHAGDRGAAYYLDDVPVRDATVLRGHAVRALYLASGALDVATELGDEELARAVEAQWAATVHRRTYVTGAMGSHHQDEAFGDDFELPPDRAYGETCAGIASVMLSWRLLLRTGETRYADLAERTLLNNVLASPRSDGHAFFYSNTLHQRTRGTVRDAEELNPRAESGLRAPWFEVSCCPTNVARTLASFAGYVATATPDGLQIHQYASAEIATELADGPLGVSIATGYPFADDVRVTIATAPASPITLALRIPPFARGTASLEVDGISAAVVGDTATVTRVFRSGEVLVLTLPRAIRRIEPDPRIDAVRGSVAFERGPLVLALESVDLPAGADINDVVLLPGEPVPASAGAVVAVATRAGGADDWPYDGAAAPRIEPIEGGAELRPYFQWANRGPSTMRVWLPLVGPAVSTTLHPGPPSS